MAILTSNTAYEQLRTEAIPTFGWPFFAALPVGVAPGGPDGHSSGRRIQPVPGRHLRARLLRLRNHRLQRLPELAGPYQGSLRHSRYNQARDRQLGIRRRAGVPRSWSSLFLALIVLVSWFIVTSSFGRVLTAIREDERATEVFGYQVTHYKLADMGHLGHDGGPSRADCSASWTTFVDPNSFILLESMLLVSIVILGGLATIWGSLLGAMAFVLLEEGMRFLPFLPDGVHRPSPADRTGHPPRAAHAVQAPGPGREVQAVSADQRDPNDIFALRDAGDLKTLRCG